MSADLIRAAYDRLTRIQGFSPEVARGILGQITAESGMGMDTAAFNPNDPGGGSRGIAQWNRERLRDMQNYQSPYGPTNERDRQIDFLANELRTTHKGVYDRMTKATNPREMTAAALGFEAPEGYTRANPYGAKSFNKRFANTASTIPGILGGDSPVSSSGGATPAQVKQAYDLAKYAARQGIDVSGFGGALNQGLGGMLAALPPEMQGKVQIASGYRSPEYQKGLWDNALKKYGSEAAARKWVAPPGRSQHGFGNAADLKYLSPEAKAWVHANAKNYGLALPLGNEPWHIEAAGSRVGGKPVNYALGSGAASPSTALALGGSGGGASGGAGVGGGQPAQSASAPAQATPEQKIAGGIGGLIDAFTGGGEQAAPAPAPSPLSQPMMQPANQPEQNGAAQMMASLLDRKRQSYTPNQPGIFQKGPFA